ncbi:hypothetical protein psyc5s11_04120 [Clostridium gelidum]|uniref:Uncharacterized protein n=1 Tax=Clostridium gelidum TaxID=704125 RepID=A0ABN6IU08_9CLOT|nr:hypothetical protein [Clostridium gelidum]BCZ44345.1 hypothetical protein psyc5s11_04120 [Clostridium gelidum]
MKREKLTLRTTSILPKESIEKFKSVLKEKYSMFPEVMSSNLTKCTIKLVIPTL